MCRRFKATRVAKRRCCYCRRAPGQQGREIEICGEKCGEKFLVEGGCGVILV